MNPSIPRPKSFYQALPKVELHRHLEGSLRLGTMLEVAHQYGLDLPSTDPPKLRAKVQIGRHENYTFENFLAKFDVLRLFYRSPEIIQRITREAVEDAAADNVQYLELRFTPVALGRVGDFPLPEVMDWVIASTQEAEQACGLTTRLIASVNRHESPELGAEVARLAIERMGRGIVGLDLAGDEANYPAQPFARIFQEARQAGLRITVHAGEWGSANNIIEAIELFGAERVGHGVRILENPEAVALARERGTVFEVCPTSNYQSGVVASLHLHPLPQMAAAGLQTTINTDDPGVSGIDLSDEYYLACEALSLSLENLQASILRAAQAAFLRNGECQQLTQKLAGQLL